MFSSLGTKLAMKKLGVPKDALNIGSAFGGEPEPPPRNSNSTRKGAGGGSGDDDGNAGAETSAWPKWMTVKSLPLAAQTWLTPAPSSVDVAPECPKAGEPAPEDPDRKLLLGNGRVMVVFLRCVGCAFAQKTFINFRTLANRHQQKGITFIAVSHSSAAATAKWTDLLGGAWNVRIVIDEDRDLYARWGLGLSSVWYYFNPTTQSAAWREKGWLGSAVAASLSLRGADQIKDGDDAAAAAGPMTIMGNKWQQAGAFCVDQRGTVLWGVKARSADDLLDLDAGCKAFGL